MSQNPTTFPHPAVGSLHAIQEELRRCREIPNSLKMLAQLFDIPSRVGDDLEDVLSAIEEASIFLPDLLGLLADGAKHRVEEVERWANTLETYLPPGATQPSA